MTKQEAILISAYTGFLLTKDFNDVHKFCEELLGRPLYTHELVMGNIRKEIQDKCLPKIVEMVMGEVDNTESGNSETAVKHASWLESLDAFNNKKDLMCSACKSVTEIGTRDILPATCPKCHAIMF